MTSRYEQEFLTLLLAELYHAIEWDSIVQP